MKEVEGLLAVILIVIVLYGTFMLSTLYKIISLLLDIKKAQTDKKND